MKLPQEMPLTNLNLIQTHVPKQTIQLYSLKAHCVLFYHMIIKKEASFFQKKKTNEIFRMPKI